MDTICAQCPNARSLREILNRIHYSILYKWTLFKYVSFVLRIDNMLAVLFQIFSLLSTVEWQDKKI